MKKVLDKFTASRIALVLNKRGFVTHDDFSIGSDDEFGAFLKSKVITLRNNGYIGGRLQPWNTSFRQRYYTYGIMDEDRELTTQWLDAYTTVTATDDGCLAASGLSIGDLSKLLLGLTFQCSKGHETHVASNLYSFSDRNKPCTQGYAMCAECGEEISEPSGVYRLF